MSKEQAPLTILTNPTIVYHHCWMACKDQEQQMVIAE